MNSKNRSEIIAELSQILQSGNKEEILAALDTHGKRIKRRQQIHKLIIRIIFIILCGLLGMSLSWFLNN